MLAMPATWLGWSVRITHFRAHLLNKASRSIILFIACIALFIWRTGTTFDESLAPMTPHQVVSPRVVVSFILALGIIYFGLIIATLQRYGDVMDTAWRYRITEWVKIVRQMEVQRAPERSISPMAHRRSPQIVVDFGERYHPMPPRRSPQFVVDVGEQYHPMPRRRSPQFVVDVEEQYHPMPPRSISPRSISPMPRRRSPQIVVDVGEQYHPVPRSISARSISPVPRRRSPQIVVDVGEQYHPMPPRSISPVPRRRSPQIVVDVGEWYHPGRYNVENSSPPSPIPPLPSDTSIANDMGPILDLPPPHEFTTPPGEDVP
jgi:hypothetical protein